MWETIFDKKGNEIAYLIPTKYKIFLGKGALLP